MEKKKSQENMLAGRKVFEIASAAVMVAVIAVLSQIAIPMPSGVPVTLQTFAIALCAYFLESRYSVLAVIVYILMGLVGVPVFANFGAGPGKLFGVTGGFIWGFIFFALCCLFGIKLTAVLHTDTRRKSAGLHLLFGIIGLLLCHLCGVIQFSVISGGSFLASALLVSVPYLVKDMISVVLAYFISMKLRAALSHLR